MNMSNTNHWEEVELTRVRIGDFVYISWIAPEGCLVTANPVIGEVIGYNENLLYLNYNEKYTTVSVVQFNLHPVIMRKT